MRTNEEVATKYEKEKVTRHFKQPINKFKKSTSHPPQEKKLDPGPQSQDEIIIMNKTKQENNYQNSAIST